jgi:hypothetical protein
MKKNTAGQTVSFQAISTTDGSAVTTGTPAVYVTIDGGSQGTGGGTTTHEGNGCWSYACEQADTNGTQVSFTFVLTGAVTQTVNVYPTPLEATIAAGVPVASIAANAINAAAIADDAIAAAKVKADAVTKIQAGLATPTNITAGTITTVTNLTNLPAITANWLTAAGIQDGAITNAKVADDVDVNAKTITAGAISATTFAANALDAVWSTAARTLTAISDSSGVTTLLSRIVGTLLAGNHTAQTGDSYARLGAPAGASVSADVAAVKEDTGTTLPATLTTILADTNEVQAELADGGRTDLLIDGIAAKTTNLPASPAAVGSAMVVSDKTGFKLASDGLDQISATPVANPTTWAQRLNWVMQRFFYSAKTPTALVVKAANGDTLTTQALTDDAEGTETMGLPS